MTGERKRNGKLRLIVTFGSDRLRGRTERARAKRDLRAGREPQPRYTTGKFWTD